jgi:hypothetical protein
MTPDHCIYNSRDGWLECRHCRTCQTLTLPMSVTEFADRCLNFSNEHRDCLPAPRRVQLSRAAGWRMPANTVKVDRSTPWGNPFIPGVPPADLTLYECLAKFERHAMGLDLTPLRGKNLACWCKPGSPCHADILLQLANSKQEVTA